jgi:hypothetical protein
MLRFVALAGLICLTAAGCAGKRSCCATCCTIAGGLGLAALFGLADGAIDDAIDPRPTNTDTEAGQRKLWEWKQRQLEADSQPQF